MTSLQLLLCAGFEIPDFKSKLPPRCRPRPGVLTSHIFNLSGPHPTFPGFLTLQALSNFPGFLTLQALSNFPGFPTFQIFPEANFIYGVCVCVCVRVGLSGSKNFQIFPGFQPSTFSNFLGFSNIPGVQTFHPTFQVFSEVNFISMGGGVGQSGSGIFQILKLPDSPPPFTKLEDVEIQIWKFSASNFGSGGWQSGNFCIWKDSSSPT